MGVTHTESPGRARLDLVVGGGAPRPPAGGNTASMAAVPAAVAPRILPSQPAAVPRRRFTTVMFTDIVGSTERAARLGDDRWRDLLDNHDTIVRHELERFGGREVNTAGDGFVATFTSPSAAIAGADAIVDAVRVLGIEVRVGIHAGEVEVRGPDVAGMAVHIGARVAALAGPSEVLVSSTVRDIVTGSRHRFADRGEHDLKGVPGSWRLCALARELATVKQ
jgi:class 3 adenylate cyclase